MVVRFLHDARLEGPSAQCQSSVTLLSHCSATKSRLLKKIAFSDMPRLEIYKALCMVELKQSLAFNGIVLPYSNIDCVVFPAYNLKTAVELP